MNITHHETMNVRHHRDFGHGLQPGTVRDINCGSCQREDAPTVANLAATYRALAAYDVTTRRAAYILERARGTGRVDGHGECGEQPFTLTWTETSGYTVTGPDHQHDAGCTWASCGPWGEDDSFTASPPDTLRELRESS